METINQLDDLSAMLKDIKEPQFKVFVFEEDNVKTFTVGEVALRAIMVMKAEGKLNDLKIKVIDLNYPEELINENTSGIAYINNSGSLTTHLKSLSLAIEQKFELLSLQNHPDHSK